MDEKAIKGTIAKIVEWLRGDQNDRINKWVNADDESYKDIIRFMDICATRGWIDPNVSPFEFANDEAWEIAGRLYEKANEFFGGGSR